MERKEPQVNIKRHDVEVDDFPTIEVFTVELLGNGGSWLETWPTEAELRAFLRGLQAGSQMTGGPHLRLPLEY
jgi:hypothetical protein